MSMNRRQAIQLIAAVVPAAVAAPAAFSLAGQSTRPQTAGPAPGSFGARKFVFDGVYSELRISMKELGLESPADLSAYSHLVMEMRVSSPQRLLLWAYTTHGPRNMSIIGFGQNAWLRASVPLQYFVGRDKNGFDLASATNRRTNSCWYLRVGALWRSSFGGVHRHRYGVSAQQAVDRTAQRASLQSRRRIGVSGAGPDAG